MKQVASEAPGGLLTTKPYVNNAIIKSYVATNPLSTSHSFA